MTVPSPPLTADTATLLSEAVHKSSAWTKNGLSERLFTRVFSGLVYAQIWEDPVVDLEALRLERDSRIITIASGGCNALSYLTANPAEVVAIDLNATHVHLNRLKKAAVAGLDHAQFREFLEGSSQNVQSTFARTLAPELDEATKLFWNGRDRLGRRRINVLRRNIYRTGLLGRFIFAAHVLSKVQGVDPRGILRARTIEEQRAFFDERLAPLFDRWLMRAILSSPASLFGLGIPPAQYRELGTAGKTMAEVVRERLRKLCCDFPLGDNYFAWQAFNRGYGPHPDAPRPLYLQQSAFPIVKSNIDRLSIVHGSLTDFIECAAPGRFDRFVFLDAQDWMSATDLTRLWSAVDRVAPRGARVIFRTAGETSILPGKLPSALLSHWHYHESESAGLHLRDRSAIYGGFHIYSKVA
jgi:S-adenosylmethionine-diacylglycerol 3-amino-3-carboxypropyl transferase